MPFPAIPRPIGAIVTTGAAGGSATRQSTFQHGSQKYDPLRHLCCGIVARACDCSRRVRARIRSVISRSRALALSGSWEAGWGTTGWSLAVNSRQARTSLNAVAAADHCRSVWALAAIVRNSFMSASICDRNEEAAATSSAWCTLASTRGMCFLCLCKAERDTPKRLAASRVPSRRSARAISFFSGCLQIEQTVSLTSFGHRSCSELLG